MKISDEVLAYLPEVFKSLPDEPNNRFAIRAFEELQQHRAEKHERRWRKISEEAPDK